METTIDKSELVSTRNITEEDYNFIYASWLRGLYYGASWYSEMPKRVFMENYHNVITHTLKQSDVIVKIACLKDTPSAILGYAVFSPNALHYVFVKKAWRNIGLAKDLVPADIKAVTNLTKVGLSLMKKKDLIFNPFLI